MKPWVAAINEHGDDLAEIRDADRPRVLNAVEASMRVDDGLFDPGFIERVAAESAVDREALIARWGTGPSLVADDSSSRGEYVPLDGVNGVGIPTQLPVDGIGVAEYRRQTLWHIAQIR